MFNKDNLAQPALIQIRNAAKYEFPKFFITTWSAQLWMQMEKDNIDKIIAMRVYPYINTVALKLKYKTGETYTNLLLKNSVT